MTIDEIAEGNDLLRQTLVVGGRTVITQAVDYSPDRAKILAKVKRFSNFNKDNDPYGEHDFGEVTVKGERYFFKLDCYHSNYQYGADPSFDEYFKRVLTVMHSSEY